MVVVKYHHRPARLGGGGHAADRLGRLANPLNRPRRRHDVKPRLDREGQQIAGFKREMGESAMLLPRDRQQRFIAVKAHHAPRWTHRRGNARRDRTRAATGVQHGQARSQHRGQTAMIALERAASEDARVGLVSLFQ